MSKAKAHIRTAHGIRYRHPVPDPIQYDKPDGPWFMRLSICRGQARTAKRVCSSRKGLSWDKKPDPEAAADEFLRLRSSSASNRPNPRPPA